MCQGSLSTITMVGFSVRLKQGKKLVDACIQPTPGNHSPLITVWGAIQYGRISNLVILDGMMDRHRYIFASNAVFVQDNAPQDITEPTWQLGHGLDNSESRNEPTEQGWDTYQSGSETWFVLPPVWLNCVKLSAKRGKQFGREGSGHWWIICLVVCGMFTLLERDTCFMSNIITTDNIWDIHAPRGLVAMLLWNIGFPVLIWHV